MSHEHATDIVIDNLMTHMFDLLEKEQIKSIYPITTFSFDDIPAAFRYAKCESY
jgi:hypothetical protein